MDVSFDSITGTPHNYFSGGGVKNNPIIIGGAILVLILYYLFFASLGETQTTSNGGGGSTVFFELLLWAVFIMLLLLNGMSIFFDTDMKATIKNLLSSSPEIDVTVSNDDPASLLTKMKPKEKEVFHIPGNEYGYDDAKALCLSYGGRLATYQEVSNAYDDGADWCGYGWSDGQMALFPTQKWKWENLQSIDGHEHDCGRPGINGGYIENPNVRFGVNCYGYKPDITPEEEFQMEKSTLYQKTNKEVNFEKKVDFWRSKIPEILLAPFNHDTWSIV
jgi:hypothetical protein